MVLELLDLHSFSARSIDELKTPIFCLIALVSLSVSSPTRNIGFDSLFVS